MRRRTNTTILTFAQPAIPPSLKAGYLNVPVEQYFPNPLRCFKCQKYGHHQSLCKHPAACARCGQAAHGDDPCTMPPHCINCSGAHSAFDKTCPKWLNEKEITKVKVSNNISFPDARKIVEGRQPTQGRSFAAVVATKVTKSMGTQTEVVHCTCQGRPTSVSGLPTSPTRDMQLQTDVETVDVPVISPVTTPSYIAAVKLSSRAAAVVAENKARLAEKQTAASAAKQAGLQRLGGKSSSIPTKTSNAPSGANGARPKTSGNNQNKTWKDTGSQPERPAKGSLDPTRDTNDYLFLSVESMDSLDVFEEPNAAAGGSKGRKFASSKKPS
jgi:hypothetical protein